MHEQLKKTLYCDFHTSLTLYGVHCFLTMKYFFSNKFFITASIIQIKTHNSKICNLLTKDDAKKKKNPPKEEKWG